MSSVFLFSWYFQICDLLTFTNAVFFDLESPRDRLRLQNPQMALEILEGLVIIDEIQVMPELFEIINPLPGASREEFAMEQLIPARYLYRKFDALIRIFKKNMEMIDRPGYLKQIRFQFKVHPVVAVLGPRRCGKKRPGKNRPTHTPACFRRPPSFP